MAWWLMVLRGNSRWGDESRSYSDDGQWRKQKKAPRCFPEWWAYMGRGLLLPNIHLYSLLQKCQGCSLTLNSGEATHCAVGHFIKAGLEYTTRRKGGEGVWSGHRVAFHMSAVKYRWQGQAHFNRGKKGIMPHTASSQWGIKNQMPLTYTCCFMKFTPKLCESGPCCASYSNVALFLTRLLPLSSTSISFAYFKVWSCYFSLWCFRLCCSIANCLIFKWGISSGLLFKDSSNSKDLLMARGKAGCYSCSWFFQQLR